MSSLAEVLARSASRKPERVAVKLDDIKISYGQLGADSERVAAMLQDRGIGIGERVGVMLPNVPEFASLYYGVLRHGAVVVPMNPLLKGREVAYYLADSGARVLFAWSGFQEAATAGAREAGTELVLVVPGEFGGLLEEFDPLTEVVGRDDSDTAVILYTSGTTGAPKGAELTHGNLSSNVRAAQGIFGTTEDDVLLGALPLFHSFGQTCALNCAVASGATLSLIPRFDPSRALEIIERDRVTVFEGVPTMFSAMLHVSNRSRFDVTSLRLCVSGGAAMPVEVLRGFSDGFAVTVLEGYGLSETSPIASFNHPDRPVKPGSIGTPIEGVEMRIVDDQGGDVEPDGVGEIVIRGHNVMKGYWQRGNATREAIRDGWFHTGDVARIDEDGYYFIVDRKKDLIIRGGYNVYPREVEEVLYEHPSVREAAVVSIPHDDLGEEVGAAVVLREGETVTAGELRAFVRDQVAAYKYPRHIWFVEELPKGPTGKILKREIGIPADVRTPE